jgi:hypothetical protein
MPPKARPSANAIVRPYVATGKDHAMRWFPSGILAVFLVAGIAAAPLPTSAATFVWNLEGGIGTYLSGSGTLQTGQASGGGFTIVAFSGSIDGLQVSLLGGDPGGAAISPTGAFNYDNLFFPTATEMLDSHGVLLSVAGEEGNIWNNGVPGSYSYWRGVGPSYDYSDSAVTFTAYPLIAMPQQPTAGGPSAVSEPAAASLLAAACLALGALLRFTRSPHPPPPPAE